MSNEPHLPVVPLPEVVNLAPGMTRQRTNGHFSPLVSPYIVPEHNPTNPLSPNDALILEPHVEAAEPVLAASPSGGLTGTSDLVTGLADDFAWFNPRNLNSRARYNFLAQLASISPLAVPPTAHERTRKTGIICTIGPKTNSPQVCYKSQ